jgi:hypothetical protein
VQVDRFKIPVWHVSLSMATPVATSKRGPALATFKWCAVQVPRTNSVCRVAIPCRLFDEVV